ncbi:MAG: glycoside hydrolase family 95-like protein [Bacteroidota bacterium]
MNQILKQIIITSFFVLSMVACKQNNDLLIVVEPNENDLVFNDLARTWDEGMPIGNGLIGGLVWQKDNNLRISLDRSDLWDSRPSKAFADADLNYKWLYNHRINDTYDEALKKLNSFRPGRYAPTKLPGGALEFNIEHLGEPEQVRLYLDNALCEIRWADNVEMQIFTHATNPVGWFRINSNQNGIIPILKTPEYQSDREINEARVGGQGYDILYLDYDMGEVNIDEKSTRYHQKCWGNFYYDIAVKWTKKGDVLEGAWSITSKSSKIKAIQEVNDALTRGFAVDYDSHVKWWKNFWSQSSISIPDTVLQKQWYNEIYKIGAAARANTPPITLQAVWTADDDRLPPWRGDYHHDLNTQLSYWPFYSGNKLEYEQGFVDWLWSQVPENMEFTKRHFGVEGLNVLGMSTLEGKPMFGWIQYGMSPTTSGWLAHHFYLHWKYSNDTEFLKEKAYPYLKNVTKFYENISVKSENGKRKFPISSSPEIFNDSKDAWFTEITNYDLAIVRFVYNAVSEMALQLNLPNEAERFKRSLLEWPEFDLDEENCLTFAPGTPYNKSHRHFSHLMAFHPFGLIEWGNNKQDQEIIKATIKRLDDIGPDYWTGYSYSWLGNLKARAMDGDGAADALRIFAECFCLRNTFHVNGDQSKSGKSKYTYRPFTLEGNFAFASAINEMLIQSHTGVVRLFPAIPSSWKDVSFEKLRTVGAFLVSSEMKNGEVFCIEIESESDGVFRIVNPFDSGKYEIKGNMEIEETGEELKISMAEGQKIMLTAKTN